MVEGKIDTSEKIKKALKASKDKIEHLAIHGLIKNQSLKDTLLSKVESLESSNTIENYRDSLKDSLPKIISYLSTLETKDIASYGLDVLKVNFKTLLRSLQ